MVIRVHRYYADPIATPAWNSDGKVRERSNNNCVSAFEQSLAPFAMRRRVPLELRIVETFLTKICRKTVPAESRIVGSHPAPDRTVPERGPVYLAKVPKVVERG